LNSPAIDCDYTRNRESVTGIDTYNPGVRLIRSSESDMERPVWIDVVDVPAYTGEQPRILGALDALADQFGSKLDRRFGTGHS
jgi:hypothetical protein